MSFLETERMLNKVLKILNDLDDNSKNYDLDKLIIQQNLFDIADCKYSTFIQDNYNSSDEDILDEFRLLSVDEKVVIVKYLDCCIGFMNKCVDDNKPYFYDRFVQILALLENLRNE